MKLQLMNLNDLEKIAKKIFHDSVMDIRENPYSEICGEIVLVKNMIISSDLRELEYFGFFMSSISKTRTGFIITVLRYEK